MNSNMVTPPTSPKRARPIRLIAAVALYLFFAVTYCARPDGLQLIHWWPITLWTPVMLLPWVAVRFWKYWRPMGVFAIAWALLAFLLGEPSWNILTPISPHDPANQLVVSLNCAAGEPKAAAEAFALRAQVVLLQEVGSKDEFVAEARKAGYTDVVWGNDDAIFAHSPLSDPVVDHDFVAATLHVGGQPVRIVSLRLAPPVFRLDWWNPECWRAYADDLRARRVRFGDIATRAKLGETWIVGGDFNATNPRIVRDHFPNAREAKKSAHTWIGTGTNDYPFAPVDQIWSSGRWVQASVVQTQNSDHRMVVGELKF